MSILWTDIFLMLIALGIAFYTLTYALWLWRQNNKSGAFAVVLLAAIGILYPGFVLFFVHT